MILLIGIDDTDNTESRGTGFLSRNLAKAIELHDLALVTGISRHQLFVHPDIEYTSQNSSACLYVESDMLKDLLMFCKQFLLEYAAAGSDVGLCISNWENVNEKIIQWGRRAKKDVLKLEEAIRIATASGTYLEGLTGTKIGQIGALAAVGLRREGNDGRLIWMKKQGELRDFDSGIFQVNELKSRLGIDRIQSEDGRKPEEYENILCDGWTRPVILKNKSVLFVEKINFADYGWKTVSKDIIRQRY